MLLFKEENALSAGTATKMFRKARKLNKLLTII